MRDPPVDNHRGLVVGFCTTPISSAVGSRPSSRAVSVFVRERRLITNLYIDGFNLYYRALKDTPFRWLDLRKLAETLFPQDSINRVCYFTARLDARPGNPAQRQRQQAYLRALATLPGFDAYYGVFRSGVKRRPLAEPVAGLPSHVLVRDSEEKGSDVNLATRLLVDGFNGEYEQAVVVSNDADFSGAMRYVRDDLGLRMTLVNPMPGTQSEGTGRRRDLREASVEEPSAAEPASRHAQGRSWRHHQTRRVVTLAASFYRLSQTPQCPSHSLPNPSAVLLSYVGPGTLGRVSEHL